jgi:hypothetical protein
MLLEITVYYADSMNLSGEFGVRGDTAKHGKNLTRVPQFSTQSIFQPHADFAERA